MTTSRRRRWGWIAGVAMFLHLAAGWNAPACGQVTTTFTTSTTASTTYAVPGGRDVHGSGVPVHGVRLSHRHHAEGESH